MTVISGLLLIKPKFAKVFKYETSVITLSLLHPLQLIPVQNWTFEPKINPVIKIGRSIGNDVILYSAVVSRHHLEIKYTESRWELINIGSNGIYIDGKRVAKAEAKDGMIVSLASSGPKIKIKFHESDPMEGLDLDNNGTPSNPNKDETEKETRISS